MNQKHDNYDPSRDRLNLILTWKTIGHLSFKQPVSESKRIKIFIEVIRQLECRFKMHNGGLRWVLKEEGDYINKLFHFHFLLDGSNLVNKDSAKLAVTIGNIWEKCGGGNHDVRPYNIQRDEHGFQRAVNYLTKLEGFRVPFSTFFNAGEDCHLKFSDGLDRHLAAVCNTDHHIKPKEKYE